MTAHFNSSDPLAYQGIDPQTQPDFIYADRLPRTTDVRTPGTHWEDASSLPKTIWITSEPGVWIQLNSSGGAIATLSAENGAFTPPLGSNFNISGSPFGGSAAPGAIMFSMPASGQMDAVVQTDNTTIAINAATNRLEVLGTTEWSWSTPAIAPFTANSNAINPAFALTVNPGESYYIEADVIASNGAGTTRVGGKQQCVAFNAGAGATITPVQNQYRQSQSPGAIAPLELDFLFGVAGTDVFITALGGTAAIPATMLWKAKVNFVVVP